MKVDSIRLALGQSLACLALGSYIESEMSQIKLTKDLDKGSLSVSVDHAPNGAVLAKIRLNRSNREFRFESEGDSPEIALQKVFQRFQIAIVNGLKDTEIGSEAIQKNAS